MSLNTSIDISLGRTRGATASGVAGLANVNALVAANAATVPTVVAPTTVINGGGGSSVRLLLLCY